MSGKWRALQHRHRYTYSAVIFPPAFIDSLHESSLSESSPKFYADLQELISLNSIYALVNHVKNLAASFGELLSTTSEEVGLETCLASKASWFYLELLFLENSLPLHRTLVSALAKTRKFHSVIGECFRVLCDQYGRFREKGKRFCVSRVALSVMGMPKLGYLVDIIKDCAILVAWDIVFGLTAVVSETDELARPSPIVMEQCQEALSCLYYLLQRFPQKFKELGGEEASLMEMVVGILVSILKSSAFSRDCWIAAGVAFCATLQVCLSVQELGLVILEGIFYQTTCSSRTNSECNFGDAISKVPYKWGNVCTEILKFSVLSRLCLIRGILTAVSRTVLNTPFSIEDDSRIACDSGGNGVNSIKTILYDGILPEICHFCENPTDSHFNFHALTVMQICLQQIKTSILANLTNPLGDYDPFPGEIRNRILRIIWNNLEDPLSQTVKQVHLIFDILLDIRYSLPQAEVGNELKLFLQKIASDLLRLGPRCKGRYVPLASLTKRLGARTMLDMKNPALLFETVKAYVDDDVCCAATSFLKCFLECLRDECWSSDGIEKGYSLYRECCLPPFLYGLASGVSKLRSNLNTYALPVLLEVDVDSIFPLLSFISIELSGEENKLSCSELYCMRMELKIEQKVAILVSLLKVSRSLALLEGDIEFHDDSQTRNLSGGLGRGSFDLYALVCIKGIKLKVLVEWLVLALTHVDESLRVDAAESLFLNPKTSTLPSHLELTLLKETVPLNMRSSSTGFQMKWTSMFRKFFSRVRTALERQYKQGSWHPLLLHNGKEEAAVNRAEDLFKFIRWLSCFLFFSCYPSAPYKRKIMAMELILLMINVWSIIPSQEKNGSLSSENHLYPYNSGITSPDSTLLLVGSIIDSWDRLRESSFRILLHFPTPLPGISSELMVLKVITWAKQLVCSPRVRESDAGALTLRLIFRKYVLELGWIVRASVNVVCFQTNCVVVHEDYQMCESRPPVIEYIKSLIDWLDIVVKGGEKDLSEACKNSFVHGVLLTLRYTFEELDWNSDAVLFSISEMRHALEKLLELVRRVTSLALWVVSADAWYLPEYMDEMVDEDNFLLDVTDEADSLLNSSEHEDKNSLPLQVVRRSDQIVMVGCWLAMKEVSLLLATIVRKIPLQNNGTSGLLESKGSLCDSIDVSMTGVSNAMLDLKQLEKIGDHFLEVLLKMKHNGAIDKTRAGFTALCNRLLCSNDPKLCKLTESWMDQLMERTVAKEQTVDDLLRRSAGIPAAFIALFLSEPEGAPKRLLPQALRWLIDVAKKSLVDVKVDGSSTELCGSSSIMSNQETDAALSSDINTCGNTSKFRDEGVIPTVHAFNALRAAFNDTNLATDTSGFSAEALIVAIRAFSSPYWEVRNSACLAYTALVRRMIGFLNVQKRESARRAITGIEFFHRYPILHPFIFNELKVATELLGNTTRPSESNLVNVVHPSLCPVLILLSRLKPSAIASETWDDLDPFLFMPFIKRCSTQSNLRVRVLASRALIGLVSNEKLPIVLLNIASELPLENQKTTASPILLEPRNGTYHTSFNLLHGILLQLGSLLDANCRNLSDFSKKDHILSDLFNVLVTCSWIASPKRCPCPVLNASFLRVLDYMLSIARRCIINKNFYAIRNLILELSTECLDVEASSGLSYYDPTIVELREQAVLSFFSCVLDTSEEVVEELTQLPQRCPLPDRKLVKDPDTDNPYSGLQEQLVHTLFDSSYEVRLATLKWLLKFLKLTDTFSGTQDLSNEVILILNWTKMDLQETLIKLLELEKNHRCQYYILRILFTWNSLKYQKSSGKQCIVATDVGGLDFDSVFQLWDRLTSLYKLTRHAKTQETLICCLAICVKQFAGFCTGFILTDYAIKNSERISGQSKTLTCLYEHISFFVNLINHHSSSSEPVSMRKAAAESMVASGLLEQAELIGSSVFNHRIPSGHSGSYFGEQEYINMYAYQIMGTWLTCIKLLEDEDDGIRQRLAMDIQRCFYSKNSGNSADAQGVPSQVEKVIESSFDHLSSVFGHWIEYFDYLSQWVLNTANYAVPGGDLVRRVFDKEIDNHHEEKLMICQICCSHLEKLPISKSWDVDVLCKDGVRNYLRKWRMKFSRQLMSFAKDTLGRQGVDWIGGLGNHKDAFLPLYGNLLGFYTLSNCIFDLEAEGDVRLLSDVEELGRTIDPFMKNHLISNLFLLVVRLHEKRVGSTTYELIHEFRDRLIWDDFEPYFLLR